jgi:hypothetical protein
VRWIALAAVIGAAAWLGFGEHSGKTARAAACASTLVHYQPTKNPGLSEIPWVRARPNRAGVVALLASYRSTLRDARVNRSDGLVLWTRGERIVWAPTGAWSVEAVVVARHVGSARSLTTPIRVKNRRLVSILRFPSVGCWRLTVHTGRGTASIVALVVPPSTDSSCDATPVEARSMALARPRVAGIAGVWSWFTPDHAALMYTHGAAPNKMNTKVLWWVRRGWGVRLHLTGVRLDGKGQFTQAFQQAGASSSPRGYHAPFPSIVNVPSAGCWLFTLRTGRLAGIVVVRAVDL